MRDVRRAVEALEGNGIARGAQEGSVRLDVLSAHNAFDCAVEARFVRRGAEPARDR